jgi:hypothetical protein
MEISKQFGEFLVTIYVEDDSTESSVEVGFYINGSFDYQTNCPHKVAITRWLLAEFKGLQEWYSSLYCYPYFSEDEGYEAEAMRLKAYVKLGFKDDLGQASMSWSK